MLGETHHTPSVSLSPTDGFEPAPGRDSTSTPVIYIGVGAAALLLLVGAAVIAMLLRRQRKPTLGYSENECDMATVTFERRMDDLGTGGPATILTTVDRGDWTTEAFRTFADMFHGDIDEIALWQ